MICNICSSVISFSFLICMCNVAISSVLTYCFVTLVRLSLVTNKGYLLTYFTYNLYFSCNRSKTELGSFQSVQARDLLAVTGYTLTLSLNHGRCLWVHVRVRSGVTAGSWYQKSCLRCLTLLIECSKQCLNAHQCM